MTSGLRSIKQTHKIFKIKHNIALGGNGGDTISNNPNKELISKRHSEKMKDPLQVHPHQVDVNMLLRICNVYNIPLATNYATASHLIYGLKTSSHG
jgi:hypothetical protein